MPADFMPFALFAIISIGFLSENPSEFLVPAVEGAGGGASASKDCNAVKNEAAAAAGSGRGSNRPSTNANQLFQLQRQASLDEYNRQRAEATIVKRKQLKYTNQVDALDRAKAGKQAQIDLLEKRKKRSSLSLEDKRHIEAQIEELEDELYELHGVTIEAEE